MTKKLLQQLKQKLEKERDLIEKELRTIAEKDTKLKDDWDTKFPKFNGGSGGERLEDAADEVEKYAALLPIEYNLELRLRDINLALEKIKKGKYGKCEKCGKPISQERLKIYPEARTCKRCK